MTTTISKAFLFRVHRHRYCPSCAQPYWYGPHPVTGRMLDYCQHEPDCESHNELVTALRRAGVPEADIAECT